MLKKKENLKVLLDIAFGNELVQIVNESTRCGKTAGSLLDFIFLDGHESGYSISVEDGLLDPKRVLLCMKNVLPQRNKRKPPIYVWEFSRAGDVSKNMCLQTMKLSLILVRWLSYVSFLTVCF